MQTLSLSEAVAVFFETKSLLLADTPGLRILDAGPLMCLHNHPHWSEVDAFYGLEVTPAEAVEAVRNHGPNSNHRMTVFTSSPDSLKEAFLNLGYHLLPWAQPFMIQPLSGLAGSGTSSEVQMRRTPTTRNYWIEDNGQPVCSASSVMTSAKAVYISHMNTVPEYRRRGLASAILDCIHQDAQADGASCSILCSSQMGLPLYLANGYEVLAYMQAFEPVQQNT